MSDTIPNYKNSTGRSTSPPHRLLIHRKVRRDSLSQSFRNNNTASAKPSEYHLHPTNCTSRWFPKCRLAVSNAKTKSKWRNVLNTFFRPWKLSFSFSFNNRKSAGCMSMMTNRHSCHDENFEVNASEECPFQQTCPNLVKTKATKEEHIQPGHDSTGLQKRILNMSINDLDRGLQKLPLESEKNDNSQRSSFCTCYFCLHGDDQLSKEELKAHHFNGSSSEFGQPLHEVQHSLNHDPVNQDEDYIMAYQTREDYGYSDKQDSRNQNEETTSEEEYTFLDNEDGVEILESKSGQEATTGNEEPCKHLFKDLTNNEDDIWSDEELISSQGKGFPPPISILANETHPGLPGHVPRTLWRSVKKGGRFVLQEVQAQPREFFQATRENGRLLLQLVRPDSDPSDDVMSVGSLRSDSEIMLETSRKFRNPELNRVVCTSMTDYSCSTDDAESSVISSGRVTGSCITHESEIQPDFECCPAHDNQNPQVSGTMKEDNVVDVTSITKPSNRCTIVLNSVQEGSNGRMDSCQNVIRLSSSPLRSGPIQNNILENTLLTSNTVANWAADNSTSLDTDRTHDSQHVDSSSNNNHEVANRNQDQANEDQFKQQHTCFQPTYGFDNNVQVLSPTNAFFQFPIQPVVR